MPEKALKHGLRKAILAATASLLALSWGQCLAQSKGKTSAETAAAAAQLADIFSKIGDQLYEECIFELSPEQIMVQQALIQAYVDKGASSTVARQLAVKQIQPPKLSSSCEQLRQKPGELPAEWDTTLSASPPAVPKKKPRAMAKTKAAPKRQPNAPGPVVALKDKEVLPRWDCAPHVDYVTVNINGFKRKLTGGEICNKFKDVVSKVPESAGSFRLGYTISTGRLFVEAEDSNANGQTIAWAISGRDVCRNNPDPDCLAARSVGSLPPGEYSFPANKNRRITWGPLTKRNVAAIYLRKLWSKDRFTPAQRKAVLRRGNIAIHMRLKGEMSEACIGLEPKGWAYVAALIKEGRATGVNVYLDEPHPKIAEAPPVIEGSSFSLTSLFK